MTLWLLWSTVGLGRDLVINDPDFEDIERYRPGVLKAYRDWWTVSRLQRTYRKIPLTYSTTRPPEETNPSRLSVTGTRTLPSPNVPLRSPMDTGQT